MRVWGVKREIFSFLIKKLKSGSKEKSWKNLIGFFTLWIYLRSRYLLFINWCQVAKSLIFPSRRQQTTSYRLFSEIMRDADEKFNYFAEFQIKIFTHFPLTTPPRLKAIIVLVVICQGSLYDGKIIN